MNIRKEIVTSLNKHQTTENIYEQLKCCLTPHNGHNLDVLDNFFDAILKSLFFRPQQIGLMIVGEDTISNSNFIKLLLPDKNLFSEYESLDDLYEYLIVDMSKSSVRDFKYTISNDGFKVIFSEEKPVCIKRLATPIYVSEYANKLLLERERVLSLFISKIDIVKFNSIDKHLLWIEIYNRFLAKYGVYNIFSIDDINEFFND